MSASGVRMMIVMAAMVPAGLAQAQEVVTESPPGIHGSMTRPGNGERIQSERGPGVSLQEYLSLSLPRPQTGVSQGTVSPFGAPSPPSRLTPAPLLPFHPNRPLVPSPSTQAISPSRIGHAGR
jgi:hypothetical protein